MTSAGRDHVDILHEELHDKKKNTSEETLVPDVNFSVSHSVTHTHRNLSIGTSSLRLMEMIQVGNLT